MVQGDANKWLAVYGKLTSPDTMFVKKACQLIEAELGFAVSSVVQLTPTDYEVFVEAKKKEFGDDVLLHKGNVISFVGKDDPMYLGNLHKVKSFLYDEYGYTSGKTNAVFYRRLAKKNRLAYMSATGHEFVQLTFNDMRPVVVELFNNMAPKTCANFKALVQARPDEESETAFRGYLNTLVHRVIPGGWIQCGDVVQGKGTGNVSSEGGLFADETFAVKHLKHGIIGMANSAVHGNGSQFYITLSPLPWLDGKKVAFGRVFDGMRTLRVLEKLETMNQRPLEEVRITDCVLLDVPAKPKVAEVYDFPTAPPR